MESPRLISAYRPYWAKRFGTAPILPMSRAEMDKLGWDSCDIILITGDAYIDHPSFGMALVGRLLEAQGFRVGIIAQPDWQSADPFRELGKPNLYFGITAGNMDSMVNHYTADRKIRSDDAYTPGAVAGKRPDRAILVYSQRCREAFPGVPLVIGSIEASLRRIAHYDYWSDKVRRSVLVDSKADLLIYGNAERALVEISHRIAKGEQVSEITDVRGTAYLRKQVPEGWEEVSSTALDRPGKIDKQVDPYAMEPAMEQTGESCASTAAAAAANSGLEPGVQAITIVRKPNKPKAERSRQFIRLPAFEEVSKDPVLYAHASRVLHLEANPGNARALVQRHGDREVWLNPPPIPLTTKEMDYVYDLTYARTPHPAYQNERIPAWEMIRFSVNIMRGCFGGCTFCSITEHEGRIIQSRSEASILKEIEEVRDKVEGFTGTISDLGGPTANMYRLACKSETIEKSCRKLSCVFPGICENLNTDHSHLIQLYRKARAIPGIKRIQIGSGLRYDLAVKSPEYVKELVQHHVGGYLKIAPEHSEENVLTKMMKPAMTAYDEFKAMFEQFSREAGKEQYLIPYFIAAHPGTTDEDMLNLALWLKKYDFKLDQVQTFTPTPMAMATAMYHSGKNPLRKVTHDSEDVPIPKAGGVRRLHKAFIRYHDPNNWPMLREALKKMGREDLIGNGKKHLVPAWQPILPKEQAKANGSRRSAKPVATSPRPAGRVPAVGKNQVVPQRPGKPARKPGRP
ncbi:YgiQ family radical SAM protein [Methylobacillus methanolivorans]